MGSNLCLENKQNSLDSAFRGRFDVKLNSSFFFIDRIGSGFVVWGIVIFSFMSRNVTIFVIRQSGLVLHGTMSYHNNKAGKGRQVLTTQ